jgi:hypothetical protein
LEFVQAWRQVRARRHGNLGLVEHGAECFAPQIQFFFPFGPLAGLEDRIQFLPLLPANLLNLGTPIVLRDRRVRPQIFQILKIRDEDIFYLRNLIV